MGNVITQIALSELIPGMFHPHQENQNDNLDNLTNSIKNLGIIEPLIVRKKDNKYEIIIGNRRFNAAKILNLEKVPAIIVEATDEQVLNMVITNNIQRKELTSKEEAILYSNAIKYPNVNIKQLSIKLGIPEDRINSKLKIIKKNINNNNQVLTQNEKLEAPKTKNNLINNDIINLTQLNKNESELRRERLNMNENQFVPTNNINNELPQNNGMQLNQEPTFGGRFFPSMDNLNNNSEIINNQEISNSPLIDLTENNIPSPEPQPIPNYNPSVTVAPQVQAPQPEIVTTPIEQPNLETNMPNYNNLDIPQVPNIPTNELNNVAPLEENNQIQGVNSSITQPEPVIQNVNIPEQPISPEQIINPNISINNIPELNTQNINTTQPKDVTPIINIFKSIATNFEILGYKITLNEGETPNTHTINIEVEK